MKPEAHDPGPLARCVPLLAVKIWHCFFVACEHVRRVPAGLPAHRGHRIGVQRYADRFSRLCLVGMNPSPPCNKINLRPFEPDDVALAQSRCKPEYRNFVHPDIADGVDQSLRFLARDPTDAPRRLLRSAKLGRTVDPLPISRGVVEEGADCCLVPVASRRRQGLV
jgi:hypothetical protein